MATRLNPYISFDGDARAALTFYHQVLGGNLSLNTFGESGAAPDDAWADKIMHGLLEADGGLALMGADTPPGNDHSPGDNIAISLSGDDAETLRGYWAGLCEGGTISVALETQMWGDEFGMCSDRFGITWMVNIAQQQT